jgi:restriction system protein
MMPTPFREWLRAYTPVRFLGTISDTVLRQVPEKFFHVRMWNQDDIIDEVLATYTDLGADIQAELPLKRIWTVALEDEG